MGEGFLLDTGIQWIAGKEHTGEFKTSATYGPHFSCIFAIVLLYSCVSPSFSFLNAVQITFISLTLCPLAGFIENVILVTL